MKKIVSLFLILIMLVLQASTAFSAEFNWSMEELPDLTNARLDSFRYKDKNSGVLSRYYGDISDELEKELINTIALFKLAKTDTNELSVADSDFVVTLQLPDEEPFLNMQLIAYVHKDHVVFRHLGKKATHAYSTYANGDLCNQLTDILEPLISSIEIPSDTPNPTPNAPDFSNWETITNLEKIYCAKFKSYLLNDYVEWGIIRYHTSGNQATKYGAYFVTGGLRGDQWYVTDDMSNNKILFNKSKEIKENNGTLYINDCDLDGFSIAVDLNSAYDVTYISLYLDGNFHSDMSTYTSTGSLKNIPGFDFKTGTIHKPSATATPSPTPTPTSKPTVTPTPTPTATPTGNSGNNEVLHEWTQNEFDNFIKKLDLNKVAGDVLSKGYVVSGGFCSRSHSIDIPKDCKIETNQSEVYKFLSGLFKYIEDMQVISSNEYYKDQASIKNNSKFWGDLYFSSEKYVENTLHSYLYIDMFDEYFLIGGTIFGADKWGVADGGFAGKIKNPSGLFEYIRNNRSLLYTVKEETDKVNYTYPIDYQNMTYCGDKFTKVEKVTFDIVPDSSYFDSLLEKVADLETTVKCTIENLYVGSCLYILTMTGNKGTKEYWFNDDRSYMIGTQNELRFSVNRYKQGNMLYAASTAERGDVCFTGRVENGNTAEITMGLKDIITTYPANKIKATNIKYECYEPEFIERSESMLSLFGLPTRDELMKDKNIVEQRLRMVDDSEDDEYDFYINFVAEMPVEIKSPPEWYAKLGDNVKVTLVGMNKTKNGKVINSYPQLRFKGDKGEQWFCGGDEREYSASEKEAKIIKFNLYSVLSFNEFTIIRNIADFDEMKCDINITDDGEIKSVILNTDNKIVTLDMSKMNCKGGKDAYEKWW